MKIIFSLLVLLLQVKAFSQHINKSGHLIRTAEENRSIDNTTSENAALFNGIASGMESSIIRLSKGYLILQTNCEGTPAHIRIVDDKNNLLYENVFKNIINLTLSPGKLFCAFQDIHKICKLDLNKLDFSTIEGSNIFAINDDGDLAYYNENESAVYLNNKFIAINEPVYKVLFYKKTAIFVTRKCLNIFDGMQLKSIYCSGKGRIFDIGELENELYISIKTEMQDEFIFSCLSSPDLVTFTKCEEVHYPTENNNKRNYLLPSKLNTIPARDEQIRCPLNFYSDTVYQPVGNSYGEIQDYGSPPYLHPGSDLLGSHLQNVYSVKAGFVKAILTTSSTFHWRMAIADENTPNQTIGYLYAHLDSTTIPYAVGDSVAEGAVIGQLVDFPVLGFVHCHFARITDQGNAWNGGWWTLDNPLSSMMNFFDTVPPKFQKTILSDAFAFRNLNGFYLSHDSLYGRIQVISKFFDFVNSSWMVDVNRIRYNLSPLSSPQTILLDTNAFHFNFYTDVYQSSNYSTEVLNTVYSRDSACFSIGDYGSRDFYHIVTNSDGNDTIDNTDANQLFNTMNYPDGWYIFRIFATDASGNSSMDSMIIKFRNNFNNINERFLGDNVSVFPNPSSEGKFRIHVNDESLNYSYELYNIQGVKIISGFIPGPSNDFTLNIYSTGIYMLKIFTADKIFLKKIIKF